MPWTGNFPNSEEGWQKFLQTIQQDTGQFSGPFANMAQKQIDDAQKQYQQWQASRPQVPGAVSEGANNAQNWGWDMLTNNVWPQLQQAMNTPYQFTPWQNPTQEPMGNLWNAMGLVSDGMQNLPNSQQGAANWQNAFGGMMQSGQGINWDPNQAQMNPVIAEFLARRQGQDQYGAPTGGAGMDYITGLLGGGQGSSPIDEEARQQWYNRLLGLADQPGMTGQQLNTVAMGTFNPVERKLMEQQGVNMSDLEARGLGRSSAPGTVMRDTNRTLADTYGSILGGLTQQDIELANANRLAAIGGLGDYNKWFSDTGLQNRGQLGNLALGMENLGQQGQMWAGEMGMKARDQAFGEMAQQAGMGSDLYNQEANRALQEETTRQGLMQTDRSTADQNLLQMLGMGATGSVNDSMNASRLLNSLIQQGNLGLGMSSQDQNAWSLLNQLGLQEQQGRQNLLLPLMSNLTGGMFETGLGANQWLGQFQENQRQFDEQMRLAYEQMAQQQPGFMDYLMQGVGAGVQALPYIFPPAAPAVAGARTLA